MAKRKSGDILFKNREDALRFIEKRRARLKKMPLVVLLLILATLFMFNEYLVDSVVMLLFHVSGQNVSLCENVGTVWMRISPEMFYCGLAISLIYYVFYGGFRSLLRFAEGGWTLGYAVGLFFPLKYITGAVSWVCSFIPGILLPILTIGIWKKEHQRDIYKAENYLLQNGALDKDSLLKYIAKNTNKAPNVRFGPITEIVDKTNGYVVLRVESLEFGQGYKPEMKCVSHPFQNSYIEFDMSRVIVGKPFNFLYYDKNWDVIEWNEGRVLYNPLPLSDGYFCIYTDNNLCFYIKPLDDTIEVKKLDEATLEKVQKSRELMDRYEAEVKKVRDWNKEENLQQRLALQREKDYYWEIINDEVLRFCQEVDAVSITRNTKNSLVQRYEDLQINKYIARFKKDLAAEHQQDIEIEKTKARLNDYKLGKISDDVEDEDVSDIVIGSLERAFESVSAKKKTILQPEKTQSVVQEDSTSDMQGFFIQLINTENKKFRQRVKKSSVEEELKESLIQKYEELQKQRLPLLLKGDLEGQEKLEPEFKKIEVYLRIYEYEQEEDYERE